MTKSEFRTKIDAQKDAIFKQDQRDIKHYKKWKWIMGVIGPVLGVALMTAGAVVQPLSILGSSIFAASVMGAIGLHHEQLDIEKSGKEKREILTETASLAEKIEDKKEDCHIEQ